MQDLLCLDIPVFKPKYKRWKKYGYKNETERQNLKKLLCDTTDGYCMYCYSRIDTDRKFYGHLEHAIEKNNSTKLIECIPNIGIACPSCNLSFKKQGENERKINQSEIDRFEKDSKCSIEKRKQCTVPCRPLRKLQKIYSIMPGAEILLQPMNVMSETKKILQLQYNVLKMEFAPKEDENNRLTEQERIFVKTHINRFHLNDPEYRTTQLRDFVGLTIDTNGKMPVYEYNNMVVKLFAERLKERSQEECLKICSRIYPILVLAD